MLFRLWISKPGVTLIELSVVLILMVTFLFIAGAQYGFLQRMIVRAELEKIASICYYLQRVAMIHNKPTTLQFNTVEDSYTYNNATFKLSSHVCFGVPYGVKGPPAYPTNVIDKPVTFSSYKITFHPDGVISSGTLYITDTRKRYAYALSCAVAQVSYLRAYFYNGNTWQLI